jgi:hypothetical protein
MLSRRSGAARRRGALQPAVRMRPACMNASSRSRNAARCDTSGCTVRAMRPTGRLGSANERALSLRDFLRGRYQERAASGLRRRGPPSGPVGGSRGGPNKRRARRVNRSKLPGRRRNDDDDGALQTKAGTAAAIGDLAIGVCRCVCRPPNGAIENCRRVKALPFPGHTRICLIEAVPYAGRARGKFCSRGTWNVRGAMR